MLTNWYLKGGTYQGECTTPCFTIKVSLIFNGFFGRSVWTINLTINKTYLSTDYIYKICTDIIPNAQLIFLICIVLQLCSGEIYDVFFSVPLRYNRITNVATRSVLKCVWNVSTLHFVRFGWFGQFYFIFFI